MIDYFLLGIAAVLILTLVEMVESRRRKDFIIEKKLVDYIYKVDGDYIKYYNPKTEALTGSEKIVTLTKDELVVVNQYNDDELKYFKRL